MRRVAGGLADLRIEVEHDDATGRTVGDRAGQLRDHEVRDDRRVPGARAQDDGVRLLDRRHGLAAGRRLRRVEADVQDVAGRRGDLDLAPHDADLLGMRRVVAQHLRDDRERHLAAGQHPAVRLQQRRHPVEPGHGVAGLLPQGGDQQVADRVAGQLPLPAEPVLDDLLPGAAPGVVAAQRGQGHPQVPRRQDAELRAQPAAGPAVVGHADDGGERVGHPAQGLQRGCEAVPAPERDDTPMRRGAERAGSRGRLIRGPGRDGCRTLRCRRPRAAR